MYIIQTIRIKVDMFTITISITVEFTINFSFNYVQVSVLLAEIVYKQVKIVDYVIPCSTRPRENVHHWDSCWTCPVMEEVCKSCDVFCGFSELILIWSKLGAYYILLKMTGDSEDTVNIIGATK